jgi:outer membrane protein assembly factor BamA
MTCTRSRVIGLAASFVLASALVFGQHQDRLTGIRGLPVEGHDIVAGIDIFGTKQIDYPKILERLRANGADLKLGLPLETPTLCRFKEVLLDIMREKGFLDAQITHETGPTYGNPRHLTLKFTITEGKRTRPRKPPTAAPSPAERCSR